MLHRLPNGVSADLKTISSIVSKEDLGPTVVIFVGGENKYLTSLKFDAWNDAVAYADGLAGLVNTARARD